MSFFVFSVLCYLTPRFAILTMQPVFFFQFLLDIYYAKIPWPCKSNGQHSSYSVQNSVGKCWPCKSNEQHSESEVQNSIGKCFQRWCLKIREFFCVILENKSMRFLAFLLQISGIVGFIVFIVVEANVRKEILFPAVVLPLSIATLSIVWSNKVQEYLLRSQGTWSCPFSARYKASEFYGKRVGSREKGMAYSRAPPCYAKRIVPVARNCGSIHT